MIQMFCIAGKNNIAVDVARYVVENFQHVKLCLCPVKEDDAIDGWQKSLRKFGLDNGIVVVEPEELYAMEDLTFLSLEFNKIIVPQKFQKAKLFNIHFSKLPKYRGMYTSAWTILNNEKESGVTLHAIDNGIDTGETIDQICFEIDLDDTAESLYKKYLKYGTMLAISNIENLLLGRYRLQKQNLLNASYYGKASIDYKNLRIDLNQPAIGVYNQVRAFYFPYFQKPKIHGIYIKSAEITNHISTLKSGNVVSEDKESFVISTLDYDLRLLKDV